MKIVFLTQFGPPNIGGDVMHVMWLANELKKKGHEIHIFCSNKSKDNKEIKRFTEVIDGIYIHRFRPFFKAAKTTFFWSFKKELFKLKPDIIHAHFYRQYYATIAPKYAKQLKAKSFLTTHAPFVEKELRPFHVNLLAWIYDKIFGKRTLNAYNKIIAISEWEYPYLKQLGMNMDKVIHLSNGIPEYFFEAKHNNKKTNNIFTVCHINPIKNLEVLIRAAPIIIKENPKVKFIIAGPADEIYKMKLDSMIESNNLNNYFIFPGPIFDQKKKIKMMLNSDIFAITSWREAIPTTIVEAQALGKITISSRTQGGKELIGEDRGFLFDINNANQLAEKVNYVLKNLNLLDNIRIRARKYAENNNSWPKIAEKLEKLYKE
ncbi:glycosyltransferase family 4 protein [Candidatus Woesearchaeota archaeon]|nr:glycosyltransferase family 4 protein [Candidatus Woesearchaeota archaeon]